MASGGLWWLVASTDIWSWLASVGGALRRIHRPDDQLKGMTVDANTTVYVLRWLRIRTPLAYESPHVRICPYEIIVPRILPTQWRPDRVDKV